MAEESPEKSEAPTTKKDAKGKRKAKKGKKSRTGKGKRKLSTGMAAAVNSPFPRHTVEAALRIPKAILEQHAGKACTPAEAAKFTGGSRAHGQFRLEVSSATKYGFLDRPQPDQIQPTELAKQILRPQQSNDEVAGYRQAILNAPVLSDVYNHYRGEHLPDDQFLRNTVVEKYGVPLDKFEEFHRILIDSLTQAQLLAQHGDKVRVVDFSSGDVPKEEKSDRIKKLERSANISATDTCFVMQPFANPLGSYYSLIYKPAIEKAGLTPIRADADMFGAGKIMDQVWSGINAAKVLVAELTNRNPNVFYELGLAHALKKPVVLVSSSENDVPFDLQHIRVIYYDVTDPFWGAKLLEKVAENILSAINNPAEAIFKAPAV